MTAAVSCLVLALAGFVPVLCGSTLTLGLRLPDAKLVQRL